MPMFYFHVCDGAGFCEDEEGCERPDLEAAIKEAMRGLRDLAAGELQAGMLNLGSYIEIQDEQHQLVALVTLQDAVKFSREAKQT